MHKSLFIWIFLPASWALVSCRTSPPRYGVFRMNADTSATLISETKARLNGLDATAFAKERYKTADGAEIPYRLLAPASIKSSRRYPLVITFHNSARTGTDNEKQLEPLARLWLQPDIRKKYPAYVLAPQFAERSSDYTTDSLRNCLASVPSPAVSALVPLIDSLKNSPHIDPNRIYLVGYSMGGSTVLNLLKLRPDLFAAAVAVAGVPSFDHIAELQNIPIWLIHGEADHENPFLGSQALYEALAPGKRVRFWVLEHTAHHNVVSPPILGRNIPEWLFSKKKR